ncbi:MAG: hypothetical protein PUP91_34695 [Rhizonema sp. PD37]|nr:hypothetical protein [Rhizonema sp. PD37]
MSLTFALEDSFGKRNADLIQDAPSQMEPEFRERSPRSSQINVWVVARAFFQHLSTTPRFGV